MNRRFWKYGRVGLACLSAITLGKIGLADSIWDRREYRSGYLFTDNRARRVGDLLTVVVREVTDAKNNDQRKLDKASTESGKFSFSGKSSGNDTSRDSAANLDSNLSTNRTFSGSAEYGSDRKFLDQMTVTVVDVLPNGNLLIEGVRKRVVSNETRVLRVSGIVRPNDVEGNNIVESRFIGNFTVAYEGNGVESKFTNQGWLGRVGNKIWPW